MTIIIYFQLTGSLSCCREIIDVSRRHFDVNVGFKQLVIAVDGYAATNLLCHWMTLQSCAVIYVISLTNMNRIKTRDF